MLELSNNNGENESPICYDVNSRPHLYNNRKRFKIYYFRKKHFKTNNCTALVNSDSSNIVVFTAFCFIISS